MRFIIKYYYRNTIKATFKHDLKMFIIKIKETQKIKEIQ